MKKRTFYAFVWVPLFSTLFLSACGGGGGGGTPAPAPTYTITYDGNSNTGGSVPVDGNSPYPQGATVTVLGNTGSLAKTDFTFTGWNLKSDGTGTTYTQGQTFTMPAANVTLYAKWTADPTYTVTYDANGGTGTVPAPASYEQGQTVVIQGNTGLTRTGYSFTGWNTQLDGNGTAYTQSQTFAMGPSNVTLYAMWTSNPTYTVTYSGNGNDGGTVPSDSTNYQQNQMVMVLGNTGNLTKNGFIFSGWNKKSDGSGTTYTASQTFSMGATNVILYAMWSPTYNVAYDANGGYGTVPIDPNNYKQGQTVTVLGNTGNLTKTGFFFTGWNTKSDGTGTSYTQSQPFTIASANVTLYAIWTPNPTYTVTYDGNGNTDGTVPTDTTYYQQGQTVTVLANTGNLFKTGFVFAGWNTAADGSGTTYAESQTFTMGPANVTLYAKWAQSYAITYNANGATGGTVPPMSVYPEGQTVTVFGNIGSLVKNNYTFSGWNTAADGSGATYGPGATFTMPAASVVLYAQWTMNPYTITYDGNGSTGGNVPVDATYYAQGQTVSVPGNTGGLVNTGYSFVGWNTAPDGSGTSYTQSQTFVMGTSNVTLYAIWTASPTYTVTYDGNGSTGGTAPVDTTSYQQGTAVTVLGNTGRLVKNGFSFVGWNTAGDGSGTTYTQAQTFPMGSANVTLYALWTANPVGAVNLPKTGQVTSYSTGDDGDLQKGVSWPIARFSVASSGTGTVVTDNLTGLMWVNDPTLTPLCSGVTATTWQGALDYVACLNSNSYLGYSDWRVPNINELGSLIDVSQNQPALPASASFVNVGTYNYYWSSTTYPADTTMAIAMYMIDGSVNSQPKTTPLSVWPVRDAGITGTISLPKTGQSASYATGDDGDLQKGVSWPTSRFSVVSSGTGTVITDNLTGLVWTRDAYTPTVGTCTGGFGLTWQAALNYVACLNTNSYLGYSDWRLPNKKELESLVNYGEPDTSTWLNTQGFNAVNDGNYWTSTTFSYNTNYAWGVDMNTPFETAGNKTTAFSVWPVRSGQ